MPSSKKVAWSQLKVGIMALLAFVVLAVLIFLLTGVDNPFADKATLYTYMRDSAAMTEGSGVRLNGILIGRVKRIELTGLPEVNKTIRMVMEIETKYLANIPKDSQLGFSAESVLGAKFLNIQRGTESVTLKDGDTITARDERDFLELVQSAMPLLSSAQTIVARIDRIVAMIESGQGSIGKLLADRQVYDRLNGILGDAQKISSSLSSGKGTIGRLLTDEALYDDVRRTVGRLDHVIEGLEQGQGTAGKLLKDPALYDELRKTSSEMKVLLADLNAGKGTAGKLLKDDAAHTRLVAALDRINTTMDKVNAGQGTIGQLMVNPALYENLAATTEEMRGLMKDFRANPKKFLTIQLKLF
jgi:phospholipid/cholesterol/gamma-HCH transport system substrate-binding protein